MKAGSLTRGQRGLSSCSSHAMPTNLGPDDFVPGDPPVKERVFSILYNIQARPTPLISHR